MNKIYVNFSLNFMHNSNRFTTPKGEMGKNEYMYLFFGT